MKNVMITGSNGYIGSNLCNHFNRAEYNIIEIDKKIDRDILDINLNVHTPDIIIHLAAIPSIKDCEDDLPQATKDNVLTCIKISDYAKSIDVPIFFASSQAVKTPKSSVYAYTKYIGEQIFNTNNNFIIMRFANVFGGINFIQDKTSVVAKWIRRYTNNKSLVINGDGNQTRDFVHVDDICRFILYCIENGILNKTLDVGTGIETSINQLKSYFPPDAMFEYNTQSSMVGVMSNVADTSSLKVMNIKPETSVKDYLDSIWVM